MERGIYVGICGHLRSSLTEGMEYDLTLTSTPSVVIVTNDFGVEERVNVAMFNLIDEDQFDDIVPTAIMQDFPFTPDSELEEMEDPVYPRYTPEVW